MNDSYPQALRDAIQRNVNLISESTAFVSLYTPEMADFLSDPPPAIQLAIAILMDKPIIVACLPGQEPTAKLRAVADHVIYGQPSDLARQISEALS